MNTLYAIAGLAVVAGLAIWLYGRAKANAREAIIRRRIADEQLETERRAAKVMAERRSDEDVQDRLNNGSF